MYDELICQAVQVLQKVYVPLKHFVVCVLQCTDSASGKRETHVGFNLKTIATRASVCAEAIALANSFAFGCKHEDYDKKQGFGRERPKTMVMVTIAACDSNVDSNSSVTKDDPIKHEIKYDIVSPCGICRELLFDYAPELQIVVDPKTTVSICELLPRPYKRVSLQSIAS